MAEDYSFSFTSALSMREQLLHCSILNLFVISMVNLSACCLSFGVSINFYGFGRIGGFI